MYGAAIAGIYYYRRMQRRRRRLNRESSDDSDHSLRFSPPPPPPPTASQNHSAGPANASSRRPSHLSPSHRKHEHEPAMPARAIQKSKSHQGPLVPNLLPCRIHRDGSVDASGRYWKPISKGELAFSLFSFFLFLSFFSFFGLFLGGERGGVAVGKGEG